MTIVCYNGGVVLPRLAAAGAMSIVVDERRPDLRHCLRHASSISNRPSRLL